MLACPQREPHCENADSTSVPISPTTEPRSVVGVEVRGQDLSATSCSLGGTHVLSGSAGEEGTPAACCRALQPPSGAGPVCSDQAGSILGGWLCPPGWCAPVSHQPGNPILSGPLTWPLLGLLGDRCWACPFSSPFLLASRVFPHTPFPCRSLWEWMRSASQSPDYFLGCVCLGCLTCPL
ncbi:hypothetical protein HJG60_011678 [Phyllostomus discolor]|uniref:Uncharacterized protein n=1 Tax=Phyllostomus discolor TaxID=89673 RepID=A0A833ZW99_9CHIR|nr:hypothetical protein HJG60_011678 [Phyllostomus discolor]